MPWVTHWIEQEPAASVPTALYGAVLIMAGLAYLFLQIALVRANGGKDSLLARAVGRSGKEVASVVLYSAAIGLAFVRSWIADVVYACVAVMWLVPDRRIERAMKKEG